MLLNPEIFHKYDVTQSLGNPSLLDLRYRTILVTEQKRIITVNK